MESRANEAGQLGAKVKRSVRCRATIKFALKFCPTEMVRHIPPYLRDGDKKLHSSSAELCDLAAFILAAGEESFLLVIVGFLNQTLYLGIYFTYPSMLSPRRNLIYIFLPIYSAY